MRSDRGFLLLRLAAVLVPLLGIATAGIASWQSVQQEAGARVERTVELLRQNALRALAGQEAVLTAIAHAAGGRGAEELRADRSLHALLADLSAAGAPEVSGMLVTDGAFRIANASWEFPARPVDLSDRDYALALRDGAARRSIGAPAVARPMGWNILPVAGRLPGAPDGENPPGMVVASFNPAVLAAFYATFAETPDTAVAMLRTDGIVLARYPPLAEPSAAAAREATSAMLRGLLAGDRARWTPSPLDGATRLAAARAVGDWPIAVLYGLDRPSLLRDWLDRMVAPIAGGIAAIGLLLALSATAQRDARRQREEAERRAEAEAQLSRAGRASALALLAGGVAHDVKNLVQSVRSGTRVMQRRAEDPAEIRRCAGLLADAAERGGKLADAMLIFARGDAPGGDASAFAVATALAEVLDLLGRTLGRGWPVRALVPDRLPDARGDRAGYEAAVVNLAANARDAMPDGGTVTISAWTEELGESAEEIGLRPGSYVVTAVRDAGPGMDAAALARLEEPFFTTKAPGAGLGLATVRGFCARTGGVLRMESSPGRGTTAAIWLPAA